MFLFKLNRIKHKCKKHLLQKKKKKTVITNLINKMTMLRTILILSELIECISCVECKKILAREVTTDVYKLNILKTIENVSFKTGYS